jgi:hypothetical protein
MLALSKVQAEQDQPIEATMKGNEDKRGLILSGRHDQ